jgi:hypothetical protein
MMTRLPYRCAVGLMIKPDEVSEQVWSSSKCPFPFARLLDHLIRQDEERWGYRDPQRLSGLKVDG